MHLSSHPHIQEQRSKKKMQVRVAKRNVSIIQSIVCICHYLHEAAFGHWTKFTVSLIFFCCQLTSAHMRQRAKLVKVLCSRLLLCMSCNDAFHNASSSYSLSPLLWIGEEREERSKQSLISSGAEKTRKWGEKSVYNVLRVIFEEQQNVPWFMRSYGRMESHR